MFFIADFYFSSQGCQRSLPQLVFILFHFVRPRCYWLSWCPSLVFQLASWIQVSEPFIVNSGSRDFLLEKLEHMILICHLQCPLKRHWPTELVMGSPGQNHFSSNYSSCQVGCPFLSSQPQSEFRVFCSLRACWFTGSKQGRGSHVGNYTADEQVFISG